MNAQPEALRLAARLKVGIITVNDWPNSDDELLRLQAARELERMHALLNSPELISFRDGVVLEAAHQRERWSSDHDGGKSPEDWYWLIGHLAGRALFHHKEAERLLAEISSPYAVAGSVFEFAEAQIAHHRSKAVHHCITTAAAMANWHAALLGKTNMRPGVEPASIIAAAGAVA